MISINLMTHNNSLYRKAFENQRLSVTEYSPQLTEEELKSNLTKNREYYSLLEIKKEDQSNIENLYRKIKFLYNESKLICLVEKLSPQIKKCFLKIGVTDCLTSSDPESIAAYIETLEYKNQNQFGKFLILDDNEAHRNMLKGIIKRFGYQTEFTITEDDLFKKINDNSIYMILINLAAKNMNINAIIKKSYTNSNIKKFPVIAYKDMDEGLFIHEVINGLSKLTRVILSPIELYNMLVDTLFKKNIISNAASFNFNLEFEKHQSYSKETISQIYYRIHKNLCNQPSLFTDDKMKHLLKDIEKLKDTLIRVDGIRWLKEEPSMIKNTCGIQGKVNL